MKNKILFFLTIIVFTISCKSNKISMIISDRYDSKKNETTLTLLPFGNIIIPNEWKKTSFNEVSRQHFFQDSRLNTISVAKNLKEKYPFYKETQTDKEFVNEFVKWDSEYWKEQGLEIKVIENKTENNYVVWNAKKQNGTKTEVNTFFVFGVKNNFVYGFSGTSKNWTDEQTIEFLKNLYNKN